MKTGKSSKASTPALSPNLREPTLFVRMMDFQSELRDAVGLEPLPGWQPSQTTPEWVRNICLRYRQTILKSVLKLKPKGTVNWRNYGRCLGLMERYKTFFQHDLPKLLKAEGLTKLNKKEQARLATVSGEPEMRKYFLQALNRPLDDQITLAELLTLATNRQLEVLDKHRQVALYHVAKQNPKDSKLFYSGLAEGYSIFLNEDGEFSGDDRRTEVYSELLAFQYEIEKLRRSLPLKTREEIRMELTQTSDFRDPGEEQFNEVCKDIKLSMGPRGRPRRLSRA